MKNRATVRVKLLGDVAAYTPRDGYEADVRPPLPPDADSDSVTLVISAPNEDEAKRLRLLLADSERIELRDDDVRVADVVPESFHLGSYTAEGQERWTVKFEVRLTEPDALEHG